MHLTWPLVQIAGVRDLPEAKMLMAAGCVCLGFPLRLPVNKADMSEAEAAELICQLPSNVVATLICYEHDAEEIIRFASFLHVSCVQLHGAVPISELRRLKALAPELFVIKSLIVRGDNLPELLTQVDEQWSVVDGFITDSHNPATGADGATGMTHDWRISRALVKHSQKPVILAGGLNADNVERAIVEVRPAGVDVHTGIEGDDGRKDLSKTYAFMKNARAGFAAVKCV